MKEMRRGRHRGTSFLSLLLAFSLCMGGCGQQPTEETGETGKIEGSQSADGMPAIAATEGQKALRGSHRLEELNCPDPDLCLQELQGEGLYVQKYSFQMTTDGIIYRELCVLDEEAGSLQETRIQKLEPPYESWTVEAVPFLYSDGEKEYTILEHYYHQGTLAFCVLLDSAEDGTYYWAGCDKAGNVVAVLGEIPESIAAGQYKYPFTVNQAGEIFACGDSEAMLCLNQGMEIERRITPPDSSWYMKGMVSDASGEKVCWYGYGGAKVGIFSWSGESVLETSECGLSPVIDMSKDGDVYVASAAKLWQVCEGELQLVCDFYLCDYPWEELYGMKTQEDGSILLSGRLDGSFCLTRTLERSETEQDDRQKIIIAFRDTPVGMQRSISRFNRQSDRYHVTVIVKEDNEDLESYIRRLQMEFSAGRGPDIIASGLITDMSGYFKNGYLVSLEDVIEDESQYLAAAFEGGRSDGVLYGIPYDFRMLFAAYSEELTGGRSSWTLPELMDAVENSDAEILQYNFRGYDIVMWYGLYDNDNTAFIDWEKGESHLTENPFLELLEFARKYADEDADNNIAVRWSKGEPEGKMLLSGKAAAAHSWMINLDCELHSLDACFDGKAALIGYPRTEGNGIYASCNYLYVNSSSDCQEGAKEFIRFLLSREEQSRCALFPKTLETGSGISGEWLEFPVNLNAFEELVSYRLNEKADGAMIRDVHGMGGYDWSGLSEKHLEEIGFLLDNIRPDNWYAGQISDIIWEELEPYFAGDKTAEQAATLLNNRVQVYLDERKSGE